VVGVLVRFLEMWLLGRKRDLAVPKGPEVTAGLRTMLSRSAPRKEELRDGGFVLFTSWVFHLAFIVTLLFLVPHIDMFRSILGFGWPALPKALIAFLAVLGIVAMVALFVHRFFHAVRRFLGHPLDYVAWTATFLPLLTGYLAAHSPVFGYTVTLALHILSFELFIALIPFTKLMHMFTVWVARYTNGATFGRKGVTA
jgi:hypothetical protein